MLEGNRRLILASGSRIRREMLAAAGLAFTVEPAPVDEKALREAMLGANPAVTARDLALMLARAKAEAVSRLQPEAVVIGADQVLALGRQIVEKAATIDKARETLSALRGRTHDLNSAAAIAEAGKTTWSDAAVAHMKVRDFSAAFLDQYLVRAKDSVCLSVGGYEFEGLGVQLFDDYDGDYFTILGLPLVPLLAELRRRGDITA
jgi:septum formation protein